MLIQLETVDITCTYAMFVLKFLRLLCPRCSVRVLSFDCLSTFLTWIMIQCEWKILNAKMIEVIYYGNSIANRKHWMVAYPSWSMNIMSIQRTFCILTTFFGSLNFLILLTLNFAIFYSREFHFYFSHINLGIHWWWHSLTSIFICCILFTLLSLLFWRLSSFVFFFFEYVEAFGKINWFHIP